MNLKNLQLEVNKAIDFAIECGVEPSYVDVSIQIDDMADKSVFSNDLEVHYDNDCQASGFVIVGLA